MSEPCVESLHQRTTANRLLTLLLATRPAFLTGSLLPVIAALALSWELSGQLHGLLALLTLLNIALIHSGANVLNDYFDALNGGDAANQSRIFPFTGGSRFIQNSVLSLSETGRFGTLLLASGALLGLWLVSQSGVLLLYVGLLGGALAILYSAPPCLVCRGLGDLVIALCFGVLPVIGTVYIQLGVVPVESYWLGSIIGLFAAAILWINSIPDISADRSVGKHTLPVRLGDRQARYALPALFGLGFILLLIAPLGSMAKLALLAALPAYLASRTLLSGSFLPAIPFTLITHASLCLLLSVGLLISRH